MLQRNIASASLSVFVLVFNFDKCETKYIVTQCKIFEHECSCSIFRMVAQDRDSSVHSKTTRWILLFFVFFLLLALAPALDLAVASSSSSSSSSPTDREEPHGQDSKI